MGAQSKPGVRPGTKKPQRPPGQGLRQQLLDWFRRNPGKGLSAVAVSREFKVSLAYARNQLSALNTEGLVVRDTTWRLNQ